MSETAKTADPLFYQLVVSLHAGAMQQLGKVASPITGKVERSLEQAKATIDLLEMIKRKTEGNLVDDENKLIEHVLFELRMNYVDEVKKEKSESTSDPVDEEAGEPKTPQSDPNPDDNENKS